MDDPVARTYPEVDVVSKALRKGLGPALPLAAGLVDELFTPLPRGYDYYPSSFFLLSSRALGLNTVDLTPLGCAIEALSMGFRNLTLLTQSKERANPLPAQDHGHEGGMRLLVTDGLIVLSHRFLIDLHREEFQSIIPIYSDVIGGMTGIVEAAGDLPSGLVQVQRSLMDLAVRSVVQLAGQPNERVRVVGEVAAGIDRLLSEFRDRKWRGGRSVVVDKMFEFAGSLSDGRRWCLPLAHYLSLVGQALGGTPAMDWDGEHSR